jgi:cell wall-associated NlpC family hydrolase
MRMLPTLAALFVTAASVLAVRLPDHVVFVAPGRFQALMDRAAQQGWANLPIGDRTVQMGRSLLGTPYKNYTLELDTVIETPSVNMAGMDCWTFFETALAAARVVKVSPKPTTRDMLRMIELDRYRGGHCDGTFTSRLHHLEDWLQDNERRGLVKDITPELPGAKKIHRTMNYMGGGPAKHFKQLRANPTMIPQMARIEKMLSQRGIWYVPKSKVPAAEKLLRNGDIICIVTTWPGTYTSHVGLAYRDPKGTLRFMHASKNAGEVIIDSRLSDYLNRYKLHAGIMVARPRDL